jgi:hypothetical protein
MTTRQQAGQGLANFSILAENDFSGSREQMIERAGAIG